MNTFATQIPPKAKFCGLNVDWSVPAWTYVDKPNEDDGIYIIDTEKGEFQILRVEHDYEFGEKIFQTLTQSKNLEVALALAWELHNRKD